MIARLTGTVQRTDLDRAVLDVHGVGYEVQLSSTTAAALPSDGSLATLEVHTHVREDALQLFGFATRDEKTMFLRLLAVSGIGPKVALSVLSGLPPRELAGAIARGDLARLTSIPHVGKKTAERIVVELRDKIANLVELPGVPLSAPRAPVGPQAEAVSALINLGYKRPEAEAALADLPADVADAADLVRCALKGLARGVSR